MEFQEGNFTEAEKGGGNLSSSLLHYFASSQQLVYNWINFLLPVLVYTSCKVNTVSTKIQEPPSHDKSLVARVFIRRRCKPSAPASWESSLHAQLLSETGSWAVLPSFLSYRRECGHSSQRGLQHVSCCVSDVENLCLLQRELSL